MVPFITIFVSLNLIGITIACPGFNYSPSAYSPAVNYQPQKDEKAERLNTLSDAQFTGNPTIDMSLPPASGMNRPNGWGYSEVKTLAGYSKFAKEQMKTADPDDTDTDYTERFVGVKQSYDPSFTYKASEAR